MAVPDRRPRTVPPTLRPNDLLNLLRQHFPEHPEPNLDRQRQQDLVRSPEQPPESLLHMLGEYGLIVDRS